jgi:hypothetical protein
LGGKIKPNGNHLSNNEEGKKIQLQIFVFNSNQIMYKHHPSLVSLLSNILLHHGENVSGNELGSGPELGCGSQMT